MATTGASVAAARTQPTPSPPLPPAEIELDWRAPPSCPDAAQLRARIDELLGGPPRGEGTVVVVGTVDAHDGGLRLVLTTDVRGRVERRELAAPSCDELADATAIVLAVALEPGLAESLPVAPVTPEPEPEPVPEPDERPATTLEPEPAVRPATAVESSTSRSTTEAASGGDAATVQSRSGARSSVRPETRFRVGAAGELGALPGPSGGPRLAAGLAWPRARLELYGGYLAPRRDVTDGRGALYQAGMGGARGCGRLFPGPVELPVCGGIEGGAVRAATRGFDPARTRHGPWVGLLGSVGVALRRDRVGLWSALEAVVPLYRAEFFIEGVVGFRGPPVGGRLVVGLEIIIP